MFRARAGDNYSVVLAAMLLLGTTFTSVGAQTLSFGPTGAGGSGSWDNTTVNWFNGSTAVPWASGNTAAFGGTAGTVTVNGTVAMGGATFNTNGYGITGGTLTLSGNTPTITTNAGISATINSVITGSTLVKTGTGTLTIGNATNTYTGGTTVSQGTLVFGGNQALGSGTVTLGDANTRASNVSLLANFGNFFSAQKIANNIVVSGSGTGAVTIGSTSFNPGSNGTIFTGIMTLNRDATLLSGNTDRTTFTGKITGTGNITIAGSRVTLDNSTNDFLGNVTISAGSILQTNAANVLPRTATLTILGNGVLRFVNTGDQTIDGLNGSSNAVITFLAGGRPNLTVGAANGSGNFAGPIQNVISSFTKLGAGTQILSGANTYAGRTTISGGVLSTQLLANGGAASGIGASSSAAANLVLDGGTLRYTGTGASTDRQFTLATNGGGIDASGSGALNFTSTAAVALGSTSPRTLTLTGISSAANTLAAPLGDSGGPTSLVKAGTGRWVLSGNNSYTGSTTISAGTLTLSGAGSIASSARVIADGTFDLSGVAAASSSIKSLAGSGSATLGPKMLVITAANDTFSGGISGSGGLAITGGTQTLTGTSTYTGDTAISAGTLQVGDGGMRGSIIGNVANDGILAFNRSDTSTFGGSISGSGSIRQIGSGLTNLTGDSSGFTGVTSVESGSLSVNGSLCGDMNVLAGGRLQGTGFVCTTSNAGVVAPGNSLGTLTVNGNYTGNAGLLEIESVIGGDASPSDRLVVTGNTAGSSRLKVVNLGGVGARTVEGIKVIDVRGTSNGTFTLSGDYALQGQQVIVAGAYGYTLQQNGISTPTDGDWYLRSSLATAPAGPDSPTSPVSFGPLYQPGVPLFETYAQVLLGLNGVSTLEQRVGTRAWSPDTAPAAATAREGLWGRIEGSRQVFEPSRTTSGANYESDQLKLQMGLDSVVVENGNGKLVAGLTAQYGTVSADVTSRFGGGKIDTDGYGVGGTLTWYGHNGFYADGQAQAIRFDSDIASTLIGRTVASGNDGSGYALSGETGQRLGLGAGWSMTPQAQLAYSAVDFDGFTDFFGARVTSSDGDSLKGRLGLSADFESAGETGRSKVYGIANLYYEFLDGTAASVAGVTFANANDRLWAGIGAGGSYSWSGDKYALYGEVSVNTSLAHVGDSYSLGGTGGFRMTW
ncbi:autotransporter outer membrane beta-barrel domain-containing protein [Microvirga brassicacearum]|uniref:Autotransporter outer membrane beta-barrel domain-containing protein n=1 Tax=Microvirga brassicacearum TaxID=2580413 RepID=A0A5N3PED8_9HYPH|nr:autotransporter outer membrane beta-barrel domain-containing protein [Microvirga brassicacearum]KAB0268127.1 autotransporter outer membrane beta-barrel domain-containing protein [Microvirga brassicacearum]